MQQQINEDCEQGSFLKRVGPSASTAEGAPLVGPDGVVESGNGRTLAIKQAHAAGGAQSQAYGDYLTQQGYDVSGMKAPILVRERTTPIADADRPAFADAAGASPVLGMSAAERAAADAKRLPGDSLNLYRGGDVNAAGNRDFVRSFAQHVVPEGEHAQFMTDDGTLSTEGANRVRNALTQHAYGNNDLVSSLAEQADPNFRAFGGAMQDAAGPMAKLRNAIDSGNVSTGSDLARPLTEAANLVAEARRTNKPLREVLAQHDAFIQRDPGVEPLLRAAYGDDYAGKMSRVKFSALLSNYADEAQQQAGLFGANKSQPEMLQEATQRYGYGTGRQTTDASGYAQGIGAGAGQDGNRALRPVNGAQRQEDANVEPASGAADTGSSGSAGSGASNRAATNAVPAQPLVANFDQAAASRYAAARQATLNRVQTYDKAPGVGTVLKGGPTKGSFNTADSAVPNIIVKTGSAGADVAKAYLKAGGSVDDLTQAAAFSLRQAAMKDGVLDPAKAEAWRNQRKSFLSQIPDAAAKFGEAADAASNLKTAQQNSQMASKLADAAHAKALKAATDAAQSTVDDALANKAAEIKRFQKSVAGGLTGAGGSADVVAHVGSVLNGKTAVADMAHLARLTENDPEGRAAVQATVRDHILKVLQGDSKGGSSTEGYLFGGGLQKFLRQKNEALSQIMSPEQMQALGKVADSLAETRLSKDGALTGSGSPTAQRQSGAGRAFVGKLAEQLGGLASGGPIGGALGFAVGGAGGATVGANLGRSGW